MRGWSSVSGGIATPSAKAFATHLRANSSCPAESYRTA